MLKTKKLLWKEKHRDCAHSASFTVEESFGKVFGFAQQQNVERVAEI